jgi:hypothetical protein
LQLDNLILNSPISISKTGVVADELKFLGDRAKEKAQAQSKAKGKKKKKENPVMHAPNRSIFDNPDDALPKAEGSPQSSISR